MKRDLRRQWARTASVIDVAAVAASEARPASVIHVAAVAVQAHFNAIQDVGVAVDVPRTSRAHTPLIDVARLPQVSFQINDCKKRF